MRKFATLFVVLLLTIFGLLQAPTFAQNTALSLTPIRIKTILDPSLIVKIIGPSAKTLKLGPDSSEVVMLAPGEYYCLYRFKGDSAEEDIFKKSGTFKVKPWDHSGLLPEVMANTRDTPEGDGKWGYVKKVVPSSAQEFNAANTIGSANDQMGVSSEQRLNELNVIVKLGDVQYAETPAEITQQKRLVFGSINQYVTSLLLPRLRSRGIKVNYLGLRDEFPDSPKESRLLIDCFEMEGQGYTSDPTMTEATAKGVNISCELTLEHSGLEGHTVWDASLSAGNDTAIFSGVRNQERALHLNAMQNLRALFKSLTLDLFVWAPNGAAAAPASAGNPAGRISPSGSRRRKPR
jgi:hypothetical protein